MLPSHFIASLFCIVLHWPAAGSHCHDFFSLLYLCEGVFGYGTVSDVALAVKLLLVPSLILVLGGVFGGILLGGFRAMSAPALDAKLLTTISSPAPHMIYLSFVAVGYVLLAAAVARLK